MRQVQILNSHLHDNFEKWRYDHSYDQMCHISKIHYMNQIRTIFVNKLEL